MRATTGWPRDNAAQGGYSSQGVGNFVGDLERRDSDVRSNRNQELLGARAEFHEPRDCPRHDTRHDPAPSSVDCSDVTTTWIRDQQRDAIRSAHTARILRLGADERVSRHGLNVP